MTDNPVDPTERIRNASRCTATSKRTGMPCQAPAVRGWRVCRLHGAGGGHKAGPSHPRWVHGERSQQAFLRKALERLLVG